MTSSRLVDYFFIIGYDESAPVDSKNFGQGKMLWQCPATTNDEPYWSGGYKVPSMLEKMCMPLGWRSSSIYQEPTYFCSQLTNENAFDITFACFTMYEPIIQLADDTLMPRDLMQSSRGDAFSTSSGEDVVYCPKCLIILSSLRYPDTFKQILCQIYNIGMMEVSMKEKLNNLETAIANLIGFTDVPSPRNDSALVQQFELLSGLPQVSFVVPIDPKIPVTGKSVLQLFHSVGTSNALAIVIAVLAGVKIILSSVSLSKLTESIHAVISLLYPLQAEHEGHDGRPIALMSTLKAPILPQEILKYVGSPCPFIFGVHSSLIEEMKSHCDGDYSDILLADLDNNFVQLPKNENDLALPERVQNQVLAQLQAILDPTLQDRDKAFAAPLATVGSEKANSSTDLGVFNRKQPETIQQFVRNKSTYTSMGCLHGGISISVPSPLPHHHHHHHSYPDGGLGPAAPRSPSIDSRAGGDYPREILMDKQIRAVFMQLLAHIMHKYRQCLVVVRVHPNPVLKLDKFSFMKARPDLDKRFLEKFLNDNMLFKNFIEARGSPYRTVDLMDKMIDSGNLETFCTNKTFVENADFESIDGLAKRLAKNETAACASSSTTTCVSPLKRWDMNYVFPVNLNTEAVTKTINEGAINRRTKQFNSKFNGGSNNRRADKPCIVPGTVTSKGHRSLFDLDMLGGGGAISEIQLPAIKKRLDGLEKCIKSIFEGRISDVHSGLDASRKILNSTLSAKRLLVHRLREHAADSVNGTMRRVELNVRLLQFLAQLVNEALVFEDGTDVDHDIVRGVLSIASRYYCRLNVQNFSQIQQHVAKTQMSGLATMAELDCPAPPTRLPHQYLCTLIQGHSVWHMHEFWIHAFYLDVEKQLHKMYANFGPNGETLPDERSTIERVADQLKEKQRWLDMKNSSNNSSTTTIINKGTLAPVTNGLSGDASESSGHEEDSGCLETLKIFERMKGSEEQNVFSQTLYYLDLIVQLQMPLIRNSNYNYRSRTAARTYSSKSGGGESGSTGRDDDDQGVNELSPVEIEKFLQQFIHNAMNNTECSGGHYEENATAELKNQMEQQEQALTEISAAAKEGDDSAFYSQKFRPILLPSEEYVSILTELSGDDGLPMKLLADVKSPLYADLHYLPANGSIYLTTYRIIVIAHPRNVLTCDQLIHKAFPISMLLKMEKVEQKVFNDFSKEVTFQSKHTKKVWQFSFSNFQVLRVVFDGDLSTHVSEKRGEAFVESVKELRRAGLNYNYHFMPAYLFVSTGGTTTSASRESGVGGANTFFTQDYKDSHSNKGKSKTAKLLNVKTLRNLGSSTNSLFSNQPKKQMGGLTLPPTSEADEDLGDELFSSRVSPSNGISSTQTIERLEKSRLVQDYFRLQLGNSRNDSISWGKSTKFGSDRKSAALNSAHHNDFNITYINSKSYECCETYPPALVIPSGVDESILTSVKLFYRTHRLPVITWRDKRGNGSLLIRASCLINSRNVFQPFKKQPQRGRRSSVSSASDGSSGKVGQDYGTYIRALLDVIPKPTGYIDQSLASPLPGLKRSSRSSSRTSSEMNNSFGGSPKKHGGKMYKKLANKVTHNLGTLTHGFGGSGNVNTPKTLSVPKRLLFGGGGSSGRSSNSTSFEGLDNSSHFDPDQLATDSAATDYSNNDQNDNLSDNSSICSQLSLQYTATSRSAACLFVFVSDVKDKKNPFLNYKSAAEVVVVENLSSSKLRDSFTNLLNSVASPDAPKRSRVGPSDVGGGGSAGGKSEKEHVDKWLQQVSKLIHITMQVVTVMSQGKSVMLCLEDHNDMTAQVISLAQLLMDPDYRTVDGFCTLIDKEWLSFGHRFKYKTGQFDYPNNGFCPTFLLFLDAVNQALLQYPTEFEFNSFFLQTIAYHHMSNRFSTFLGNSDLDRIRLQAALYDNEANSFWTFLSNIHSTSPVFINYHCSTFKDFTGLTSNPGWLYLNWSLAALELWSFYLPETLTDANLYELDIEPNPCQPEQKLSVVSNAAIFVDGSNPNGEPSQSVLVNAAVTQITLQDELSIWLKRAVDNEIKDPNQTIYHYYRSRCPQKQLQVMNRSVGQVGTDSLIKDLAYKSLTASSVNQSSRGGVAAISSPNPSNSSSNITHQMVMLESNLEHCELCKLRVSNSLPGLICTFCNLVLHKNCNPQWSKVCAKRKYSGMVGGNSKNGIVPSGSFSGVIFDEMSSGINNAKNSNKQQDQHTSDCDTSTLRSNAGERAAANCNPTLSPQLDTKLRQYSSNSSTRHLDSVIMYKQSRHLKQWRKQKVEYYHDRNVLRFVEPPRSGVAHDNLGASSNSAVISGKCKEIDMKSILDVSIKAKKDCEFPIPNHYEPCTLIKMTLSSREYYLLAKNSEEAEHWVDMVSSRIAD